MRQRGILYVITRILPLSPHGEYSNALTELYYFSRRRWLRVYEDNGFEVLKVAGNDLFYTGYKLLPRFSLSTHRSLTRIVGSACHVFVMRAKPDVPLPD